MYSDRNSNLSFSYSKYRMLPSLRDQSVSCSPVSCTSKVDLPLASEVQAVGTIIPERHAHSGDRVQVVEAANGFVVARLPQRKLAVAHARETGCRNTVVLAHPHSSAVLGAFVARAHVRRLLLTNIPHAQLLVSGCRDQEITSRIP